jgi:predicted nucleotidyltransferase
MSDTSNPPFVLAKPPAEDFVAVVRELNQIAGRIGIPFFLAGAAARDIVLVNLWDQPRGRATLDVDFALALNDWAEFDRLRHELVATGRFAPVHRREHRLLYTDPQQRFQVPVDLIPFRGVASPRKTIAWPPHGDFVMNVAGFEETLAAALRIELEPGLVISVASLPGMALLKLLAWADRHFENNKDAADLYKIIATFDVAGNVDLIFDRELELLEAVEYDLTRAGAQLLGRAAARISDPATTEQIVLLLKSAEKVDLLLSDIIKTERCEENTAEPVRIFDCFRRGYLESVRSG